MKSLQEGSLHLFEVGEGGNGAQVIVEHNTILPEGRQGYGTVHHAAFRVEDTKVLYEWIEHMEDCWFRYFRVCGSLLFRIIICTRSTWHPF